MNETDELRRLCNGPAIAEQPDGLVVDLVATCPGDAVVVLQRIKEVLHHIFSAYQGTWPTTVEWESILPGWFVNPLQSKEGWITSHKREMGYIDGWSLDVLVHWFEPELDERQWSWWDAEVQNSHSIKVQLITSGWPFAHEALDVVLEISGATSVEVC